MKWDRFHSGMEKFSPGDFNVIDDVSGFKIKASETQKQWDGFRTRTPLKRNEQDFLRAHKERIRTPWARTEQPATFVESTNNMQPWQPATSYTATTSVVIHNGISYTANETHTSANLFIEDFNKWDVT